MNTRNINRLNELAPASADDDADVEQPEIPPGFNGTLLYGQRAQVWIPDNGRGPADQPKPNIVRIG